MLSWGCSMSALDGTSVKAECPIPKGLFTTGNASPVIHEIRHALQQLLETGESTTIDLSAIPFAPGDQGHLLEFLGNGEVSATVDSLGKTQITETTFPGVWLVDYLSPGGTRLAWHIEITTLPSLLATPLDELAQSLDQLDSRLARSPTSET
jgi:hydrogenase-1 operon protein HyaF